MVLTTSWKRCFASLGYYSLNIDDIISILGRFIQVKCSREHGFSIIVIKCHYKCHSCISNTKHISIYYFVILYCLIFQSDSIASGPLYFTRTLSFDISAVSELNLTKLVLFNLKSITVHHFDCCISQLKQSFGFIKSPLNHYWTNPFNPCRPLILIHKHAFLMAR